MSGFTQFKEDIVIGLLHSGMKFECVHDLFGAAMDVMDFILDEWDDEDGSGGSGKPAESVRLQ